MDKQTLNWLLDQVLEHWFWVLIILFNIFGRDNSEQDSEPNPLPTSSEPNPQDYAYPSDDSQSYDPDFSQEIDWSVYEDDDQYSSSELSETLQNFRHNEVTSALTRGSNALSDADDDLKELLILSSKYKEVWQVCSPSFLKIEREIYSKVSELQDELKHLKAVVDESLDKRILEDIYAFRSACLEIRNSLQTMKSFYVTLPPFSEMREAFSLLQHDIQPFCTHNYRSEIKPNVEFLVLPMSAYSLHQKLQYLFGHEVRCVFINYEILSEPTLWPLLGQETPYLLKSISPQWPQEWKEWCKGERSVPLPKTHRRSLKWRVEESLNMWGTQLLGIYLMTLRYGPSGPQALIEEQRVNGDLNDEKLVLIGAQKSRRGYQTRLAPLAIQMEVSLCTLRMNGYLREADKISEKWRSMIGHELKIMVDTGKQIPFPLRLVVGKIQEWVQSLHQQTWASWRNERFESLSGLTLSRGQWGQVEMQAQQVISADPNLVFSERTKWVALAHAAQTSPEFVARVFKAAESLHFDDQLWSDSSSNLVRSSNSERDDLIAAIALADLFSRRPVGQLQRF